MATTRMLAAKTQGPLAGLVVIDLTRVLAGPFCTMTLADLGARVIKVELPGTGDDARRIGPFTESGEDGIAPTSGYFFSINRNKESIALDLKKEADRVVFERLVASADLLVENYSPGTLHRLGYDWSVLHARWPALILASISGFGQTGPYRALPAYDVVVQAMGGVLSLTGDESGRTTRVGVSIGDLAAGLYGVIGIQAAVLERQRTGLGSHVDVAMLDAQVALVENALMRCQVEWKVPGPIGTRHPSIAPFGVFQARDAGLVLVAGSEGAFTTLCEVLGIKAARDDSRFNSNAARCIHHEALKCTLEAALAVRGVAEWLPIMRGAGIPCGPLNDVASVLDDPQVRARNMLLELPLPGGDTLLAAGCPVKFADAATLPNTPAPTLDQHRAALLIELGPVPPTEA